MQTPNSLEISHVLPVRALIDPSQNPALLSYCCYRRKATLHIMKQGENWQLANRQGRASDFWYKKKGSFIIFLRNLNNTIL